MPRGIGDDHPVTVGERGEIRIPTFAAQRPRVEKDEGPAVPVLLVEDAGAVGLHDPAL